MGTERQIAIIGVGLDRIGEGPRRTIPPALDKREQLYSALLVNVAEITVSLRSVERSFHQY
jgi:hypothetical protein